MNAIDEALAPFRREFKFYAPRALKIRTKAGQIAPFVLNRAQQYIHSQFEDQLKRTGKVRALIVKGRQQGCSTLVEGRFYWRTSMSPGHRAFILTHLDEATQNLFAMTRRFHEHCPEILRPVTRYNSANALSFNEIDSEFSVATARSKGTGRSATAQFFHGSEVGFWENAADHMAGLGQVVPNAPGTEIILESTGNGEGNLFHGMVVDAMRGRGDYTLIFVPWFWQDEYKVAPPPGFELDATESDYAAQHGLTLEQMAWRRQKLVDDFRGDESLLLQEYPATVLEAFQRQALESYIKPALVAKARKTEVTPSENAPRIMGLDPAEYGDDDTCLAYRQGRRCHRIDRWHGRSPMEVVGLVARRADEWKPEAINVDCTGLGSGIADRLKELNYPVNRVGFGERAVENDRYVIRRDEIWGEMGLWITDSPCQIPDDDALQIDLTGPTYTYDSSRRLKIEPKEAMKKRGLKSPDAGDALALTFAVTMTAVPDPGWSTRERASWRTA